ncbi:hypothetical protein E8E11_008263 [Didymella keratinophila]|nr:hypothetical protein E8E11_008263 [Didymella keratinophila]
MSITGLRNQLDNMQGQLEYGHSAVMDLQTGYKAMAPRKRDLEEHLSKVNKSSKANKVEYAIKKPLYRQHCDREEASKYCDRGRCEYVYNDQKKLFASEIREPFYNSRTAAEAGFQGTQGCALILYGY